MFIMIPNRDKERNKIKEILEHLKPVGKPKITLVKFNAKEVKKADVTRFRNLWVKLKAKVETLEIPTGLKGRKVDIVLIDECAKLSLNRK